MASDWIYSARKFFVTLNKKYLVEAQSRCVDDEIRNFLKNDNFSPEKLIDIVSRLNEQNRKEELTIIQLLSTRDFIYILDHMRPSALSNEELNKHHELCIKLIVNTSYVGFVECKATILRLISDIYLDFGKYKEACEGLEEAYILLWQCSQNEPEDYNKILGTTLEI